MTKTELKQAVVKIKEFLKQRDYDAIDTGIELARALKNRRMPNTEIRH